MWRITLNYTNGEHVDLEGISLVELFGRLSSVDDASSWSSFSGHRINNISLENGTNPPIIRSNRAYNSVETLA